MQILIPKFMGCAYFYDTSKSRMIIIERVDTELQASVSKDDCICTYRDRGYYETCMIGGELTMQDT